MQRDNRYLLVDRFYYYKNVLQISLNRDSIILSLLNFENNTRILSFKEDDIATEIPEEIAEEIKNYINDDKTNEKIGKTNEKIGKTNEKIGKTN